MAHLSLLKDSSQRSFLHGKEKLNHFFKEANRGRRETPYSGVKINTFMVEHKRSVHNLKKAIVSEFKRHERSLNKMLSHK